MTDFRCGSRAVFAGWLDECARRYGARPFVITDDVTLSYADVAEQSRRIAAGLVELGVVPGDRVGMVMANYPEFVTVKFAIARAGAIAVPFNYLYQATELGFVLDDSGCRVLVTMTGFGTLDYQAMLDQIAPQWDSDLAAYRVVLLDTDGTARPGCAPSPIWWRPLGRHRSSPWPRMRRATCCTPQGRPDRRKACWYRTTACCAPRTRPR